MTQDIAPTSERTRDLIWKRMGVKNAREISKEVGVPVDEVIRIRNEMLDSVDALSVQQERQRLIIELKGIAQDAREAADGSSDEFRAGLYNSSIAAMKTVLVELNRADQKDQEKVNHLNELRKREIIELYVGTVDAGVAEAAEKYGIDADDLFEIFNRHLRETAKSREIQA